MAEQIKGSIFDIFKNDNETEYEISLAERGDYAGITIVLKDPDDNLPFADIAIEIAHGHVMLHYWLTCDMDSEPTDTIFLDQEKESYCLKCGQDWSDHNNDGSCVED